VAAKSNSKRLWPHLSMLHTPQPGTQFYRVTDRGRSWADVLSGGGAYYSSGGRYNSVQQRTVYAAADPLVSIAEFAFHKAAELQMFIGGGRLNAQPLAAPPLPLAYEQFLWCFTLNHAPQMVDVEHPLALHTFPHQPFELLNPTSDAYHRTTMLASLVRQHPNPQQPAVGGILAPSVRTPPSHGYIPQQYVFFVPQNVLAIPGTLVRRWKLTIEFKDVAGQGVTHQTREIAWARPWIRFHGARTPVPVFLQRPNAHPFMPRTGYQIEVKFA